jgi:hypothetical protein
MLKEDLLADCHWAVMEFVFYVVHIDNVLEIFEGGL